MSFLVLQLNCDVAVCVLCLFYAAPWVGPLSVIVPFLSRIYFLKVIFEYKWYRPLVTVLKSVYRKISILNSQPKLMLWVLKRTISMRSFFWAPKPYAKPNR